jgi:hypothetical protein
MVNKTTANIDNKKTHDLKALGRFPGKIQRFI